MVSSMMKIEENAAVDGPVGSEGGRSPSALSTGQAPTTPAMAWSGPQFDRTGGATVRA